MDNTDPKLKPTEGVNPEQEAKNEAAEEPLPAMEIPHLDQPIEVAEMSESQELQRRRQSMRNKLEESSVMQAADDSSEEGLFDSDGGLMDMLKEANLGPKHLRFCCGGVLVLLILPFGAFKAWQWWQARPDVVEVTTPAVVEQPVQTDEPEVVVNTVPPDVSLQAAFIVGDANTELDIATQVGGSLGVPGEVGTEEFSGLIQEFKASFELMKVDVIALLDQAKDREAALNDYEEELGFRLFQAKENLTTLGEQMDDLQAKISALEPQKAESEDEFFTDLTDLDSFGTVASLDTFIGHSQQLVEFKADLQARAKLASFYQDLIPVMELRAKDIDLNREALVKGIQVVDIQGSDIELIIDESAL